MFSVDDSVTHYTLARHPRNQAIIDIKNKRTNELRFIKIRHRLANFYAVSLVDPKTFDVWAETQVKSAGARLKPITLQGYKDSVALKDTSLFGFEWSFEWENQKYKWVRESPMRPSLECRAMIGRGNDVCVAQYLPRGVKNEYFGLVSVLGYNLTRCQVEDEQAMELLLITSLMTILDKAGDNGWKKEANGGSGGSSLFLEPSEIPSVHHPDDLDPATTANSGTEDEVDDNGSGRTTRSNHRLDINRKEQQQKEKSERNIEQRLQWMLEKDVRRSQKQLRKQQTGGGGGYASQQHSPLGSPRGGGSSPIPSPSTSTHDLRVSQQRQQLEYLSHVLSAMKHPGDASATLPSYFVQQTTTATTTTTTIRNITGPKTQQLQSIWAQQDETEQEDEDRGVPSRRHNSHHRSQSQRRLSATDPRHVAVAAPPPHHRAPMTSYTTNNNRYSVPVPPRQHYLQQQQR